MAKILDMPTEVATRSADTLICHCYQVKASTILDAINVGDAETISEVTSQTYAGSGCGSCQCRIQRLLAGLPAECGPCALCPGCGHIKTLCHCQAA
tara:strand:+ start:2228 stop:2515 length:288 start_codon:yes stop_codon:yes gene_type:complete